MLPAFEVVCQSCNHHKGVVNTFSVSSIEEISKVAKHFYCELCVAKACSELRIIFDIPNIQDWEAVFEHLRKSN
jgi:uncharacterized protein CbrC (UPF0167 family)